MSVIMPNNLKMNTLYHTILITFCLFLLGLGEEMTLRSRLNTNQLYRSPNVKANQLYSIAVDRVSSSAEGDPSRCKSVPKTIQVTRRTELFRLSQGESVVRQQQVFQKLTTLNQQENIIEEFQVIGGKLFLITTQGDGYFLSLDPEAPSTSPQKVSTKFFKNEKEGQFSDVIVIRDYKERALVVGKSRVVLCKLQNRECDVVEGYEEMQNFRGAQLFEENGRYYLFIVQTNALVVYQLTANSRVKDKRVMDAKFFGAEQVSLRAIFRDGAKFLVLDDLVGLRQILTNGGINSFRQGSKIVYSQFGCYQIVGQDSGESLALACAPSLSNYFILKLVKSHQFAQATYQPLQTVFLHEKLYQIDYIENLLLSRVFSGVKLHWSSKTLGSPYPHFYRKAGDIFLHNAIQAKMKMINGVKTILMAAQDEILSYELGTVDPFVQCSSSRQVKQQYKLTYSFPCLQHVFIHQQNVCTSQQTLFFQAWSHKQLKIMSHIVPFLMSLIGVVFIVFAVIRIYRRYGSDVERAKLKYNIQENQLQG